MLQEQAAHRLAAEWLEAWNSHDLERIMGHYAEDVEFVSPFVVKLMGHCDGTIHGKTDLKRYFAQGLSAYPELAFRLHAVLPGVHSFTIYYDSVHPLVAAEVMELDDRGQIVRVLAHYTTKSAAAESAG